ACPGWRLGHRRRWPGRMGCGCRRQPRPDESDCSRSLQRVGHAGWASLSPEVTVARWPGARVAASRQDTSTMRDRYQVFAGTRVGRFGANKLGLPHPPPLERYHAGDRLVTGTVLTGAASGGRLDDSISKGLDSLSISSYATAPPGQPHKGIVFDGTGIASSGDLQ